MINKELVYARLDLIKRALARLKKMAALPQEEFLANPDNFAIAEHHLRRALESVFDIGRHIMAKEGLGHPTDYRAMLVTLGREKILPPDFAKRIEGMAGYRNRLVHGYAEVTPEEMYRILKTRLADFEEYCAHILAWLARRAW